MEYFRKENDMMVKYDVLYDANELESVRRMIIKNCGMREHMCFETDYPRNDYLFYENYKETPVGEKEYFEETKTVYRVEYDKINEPILAKAIKDFIDYGNVLLLQYLYGDFELSDEHMENVNKINLNKKNLIYEIRSNLKEDINYFELRKLRNLINELEELVNIEELEANKNLKDQRDYLDIVRDKLTLEKVDEINYDFYVKALEFSKKLKR